MEKRRSKISSEAVLKATGKSLEQWFKIISDEGGQKMTHTEIARMLYDKHIKSSWPAGRSSKSEGWWCQMVTVQYEYANNKRVAGKTSDAGWEIGVQKTLPISPKKAWELITSKKGVEIWLNTSSLKTFKVGETFKTKDGKEGKIRVVDTGRKLRLKVGHTTVQIYVLPNGKNPSTSLRARTAIHFHQEKLKSEKEREIQRKHWQEVLNKLLRLSSL